MANTYKKEERVVSPTSFEALITKELLGFVAKLMDKHPDAKHNVGRAIGNTFVWDKIASISKKMSDACWKDFENEGIVPKKELDPGLHNLAESPHFSIIAKVTLPVHRFNADKLVGILHDSKYKIPLPVAKMFIEDAKQAGKSSVMLDIAEKVS